MSSTTGFDGKTYVKTFCITLSTSQSSDNNYYGDYNQDVYNISTDGITFTNNKIILGGGGAGGSIINHRGGKDGLVNSANNVTINNLGAFLGGGGCGGGDGYGGAGGGGGGGYGHDSNRTWGGKGGSIITGLYGEGGVYGLEGGGGGGGGGPAGGGGGPGGDRVYWHGTWNGGYKGAGGGDGLYFSGNSYSGNSGGSIPSGGSISRGAGGGGGYGGGNGGNNQVDLVNGGGGGGGGKGSTDGYGNGGYGIQNNGSITKLVNLQGSSVPTTQAIAQTSPYLYGPLFFAGNAPSSYVMQITSQYSFGQLWCTGVGNPYLYVVLTDFTVEPSSSFGDFSFSYGEYILSNVLLNVSLSGTTSGSFTINDYKKKYAWSLVVNAINTGYDLKLVVTNTGNDSFDVSQIKIRTFPSFG